MEKCHREDNLDCGRIDNRVEGRTKVNARPLSEPFATSRALFLSTDPSAFPFILKSHWQETIFLVGLGGTSSHVFN